MPEKTEHLRINAYSNMQSNIWRCTMHFQSDLRSKFTRKQEMLKKRYWNKYNFLIITYISNYSKKLLSLVIWDLSKRQYLKHSPSVSSLQRFGYLKLSFGRTEKWHLKHKQMFLITVIWIMRYYIKLFKLLKLSEAVVIP